VETWRKVKRARRRASTFSYPKPSLKRSHPVWDFINSSFGIFLLSSVFLGLLSFSYQQWRERTVRDKRADQLKIEIALRIQAMEQMTMGKDNNRYSNFVNISKVMDGDSKASFYVRKPLFNEFDNKNMTSLLWQLYLVVPSSQRDMVRQAISEVDAISKEIREIRYTAANELPDRPKAKNEKDQAKQDDEDDHFKKDYGQTDVFRLIRQLSQSSMWKDVV
jgi:hypothetical protein